MSGVSMGGCGQSWVTLTGVGQGCRVPLLDAVVHLATVVTPDAAQPGADMAVFGVLRAWAAGQPATFPWRLHEWRLA